VKQILWTTVLAAPVTLTGAGRAAGFSRIKCCHGCGSYACNRSNCGTSCKSGTKGTYWKDCGSALSIADMGPRYQRRRPKVVCPGKGLGVSCVGRAKVRIPVSSAVRRGAISQDINIYS
jgi:hypothetical protein